MLAPKSNFEHEQRAMAMALPLIMEKKRAEREDALRKQQIAEAIKKAEISRQEKQQELVEKAFQSQIKYNQDMMKTAYEKGDAEGVAAFGRPLANLGYSVPAVEQQGPSAPGQGIPLKWLAAPQKQGMSEAELTQRALQGDATSRAILDAMAVRKKETAAAGASSVNIDNKSMGAMGEAIAKKQADALEGFMDQGRLASEQKYSLQSQRALIEDGLRTGAVQPLLTAVSGFVKDVFNVPPEALSFLPDPSKGEAFNAASFDLLLKTLQKQKGPQTEGDADRAMKTFASLGKTPEANIFILDYLESLADRQEQMSDFISDKVFGEYANDPKSVYKAEKEFRAWARKTPLVAKSPNSGLPVTYSAFKKNAMSKGDYTQAKIDELWRQFVSGGE